MVEDAGKVHKAKLEQERADWRQRVVDEQSDVKGKVDRLHSFIQSGGFYNVHDDEKGLLQQQLNSMQEYLNVLNARIKLHKAIG